MENAFYLHLKIVQFSISKNPLRVNKTFPWNKEGIAELFVGSGPLLELAQDSLFTPPLIPDGCKTREIIKVWAKKNSKKHFHLCVLASVGLAQTSSNSDKIFYWMAISIFIIFTIFLTFKKLYTFTKGSHHRKKVTKLRTFSVPGGGLNPIP